MVVSELFEDTCAPPKPGTIVEVGVVDEHELDLGDVVVVGDELHVEVDVLGDEAAGSGEGRVDEPEVCWVDIDDPGWAEISGLASRPEVSSERPL